MLSRSLIQRTSCLVPVEKVQSTFFTKMESNFDKHEENDVIDFYNERNIPRMLSREGPKAAVGDVNGDGLDDIFIGGTPAIRVNYIFKLRMGSL